MLMNKDNNGNSTQAMKWGNMHPICIQEHAWE
jgi:hypothetical protein